MSFSHLLSHAGARVKIYESETHAIRHVHTLVEKTHKTPVNVRRLLNDTSEFGILVHQRLIWLGDVIADQPTSTGLRSIGLKEVWSLIERWLKASETLIESYDRFALDHVQFLADCWPTPGRGNLERRIGLTRDNLDYHRQYGSTQPSSRVENLRFK